MQAITTKYVGPTNHLGARIVAKCSASSITVAYDDEFDLSYNHLEAAKALCLELVWTNMVWIGGSDKSDNYVWVNSSRFSPTFKL